MAGSPSSNEYDAHLFSSLFNKTVFERYARNKDIISEKSFELEDEEYPEIRNQIALRGATWKLGGGQPPQPIQLRIKELQPLARGWLELIIHNIHPSSNRSEVTVANAILIHSIIKGEDVRVEELISTRLVNIAQSLQHKGKLGFSSLIYKLCKDAGVSFREYRRTPYVEVASNITAKVIETVRGGPLPILRRH
ncbi:hypothetical protein PIB30_097658 [Stylosanthes scabra]|uniref:Putative plant transposon protein domain-containing protein n=1 Tax=Stylosanthes scabra TaxID=79078 RepID=A0ABU6YTZ3_9FABA|nr:hypothetical protein [Stylosanthes scabra]